MSWTVIARKEFRDARRSRWLWGIAALFVLIVGGLAVLATFVTDLFGLEQLTSSTLVGLLIDVVVWTVPPIGIVMSAAAINGERESGSLKLLLAPPHSRGDALIGKFVGRSAAVVVPILIGFVLPGIVFAATVPFEPLPYLGFALLAGVLGVVTVGVGVGVSGGVRSRRLSMLLLFLFYFLFVVLWPAMKIPLQFAIGIGGYPPALQWIPLEPQELIAFIRVINPVGAFKILLSNLLNGTLFAGGEGVYPLYHGSAALSLFSWTVVPLLLGWARFSTGDL